MTLAFAKILTLQLVLQQRLMSAGAYDLLLNNTDGNYHYTKEITDGSGQIIGGVYQDSVFDTSGHLLGLNQGYAFNFDNGTSFNYNNVMSLGDGNQIYWLEFAIIYATGIYERYEGGSIELNFVEPDPNFVAEITLHEPPEPVHQEEESESIKLRITSEGGHYVPITSTGEQIGQTFQNPITMPDSSDPNQVVGVNQGYGFLFPQDSFITDVLGYSSPEQVLGNRHFALAGDDGGEMLVFNEQVLHATGSLRNYAGATLVEEILSTDPQYVADITLTVPSDAEDIENEGVSNGGYNFRVTAEGGFWEAILAEDGSVIGRRFKNPVYNSSNVRIGTNEGYAFGFPATNITSLKEYNANRKFYVRGGTLDVLNEVIVAASGIYGKYSGGRLEEKVVSESPAFVSEITLVEPTVSETGVQGGTGGMGETAGDTTIATSNAWFTLYTYRSIVGVVGLAVHMLLSLHI
eukprot:CAMPEP_0197722322 /NCGR_PEP_ID=MMETSP1434-20131217/5054_1 /TAXON_ID=265543 /ORGANISM="Minutocellus polymorphus, Strain CCMP3303" /LENGTH=462 /DNA_ID=CAMNT_0043307463 /DNA_START=163 /DNA_END=1551 /DNA_ORIENTATION=+